MNSEEKICPRCAETIKAAAVVCRFCNYEFETVSPADASLTARSSSSLRKCDECGKVYADKFDSCPHCKGRKVGKGCLVAVAVLFLIGVIGSLFSGGDGPVQKDSVPSITVSGPRQNLAQCINQHASSGSYSSLDGGKSALRIMAACGDQVRSERPECFRDDPRDNSVDNERQLSPGAACRFAVVATIQIALKAVEAGIPLSPEPNQASSVPEQSSTSSTPPDSRPAEPAVREAPLDVARLIEQAEQLNTKCRGGSGDLEATGQACNQRDELMEVIANKGWCYGTVDQIQADKQWQQCAR